MKKKKDSIKKVIKEEMGIEEKEKFTIKVNKETIGLILLVLGLLGYFGSVVVPILNLEEYMEVGIPVVLILLLAVAIRLYFADHKRVVRKIIKTGFFATCILTAILALTPYPLSAYVSLWYVLLFMALGRMYLPKPTLEIS